MKPVVFTVLILGALAASAFAAQSLGVVYAKDYGVKCDGKTDDTAAIRATATAAGQGAHIQLPSGVCLVTDTITLSNSLQHWSGAGMRATIINFEPTGNKTAFLVQAPAAAMYWKGSLRDLSFSSADSAYAKVAIEIVDAADFRVENVSINGAVNSGGPIPGAGRAALASARGGGNSASSGIPPFRQTGPSSSQTIRTTPLTLTTTTSSTPTLLPMGTRWSRSRVGSI